MERSPIQAVLESAAPSPNLGPAIAESLPEKHSHEFCPQFLGILARWEDLTSQARGCTKKVSSFLDLPVAGLPALTLYCHQTHFSKRSRLSPN